MRSHSDALDAMTSATRENARSINDDSPIIPADSAVIARRDVKGEKNTFEIES